MGGDQGWLCKFTVVEPYSVTAETNCNTETVSLETFLLTAQYVNLFLQMSCVCDIPRTCASDSGLV